MHLLLRSPLQLLAAVITGLLYGTSFAQTAPLKVTPLVFSASKQDPKRFPFVQGTNASAASRINQMLFIETFGRMAPSSPKDARQVFPPATDLSLPTIDYALLRNDARVLSLRLDGEGCGAYCENFSSAHAFDVATGRHLQVEDLFTPAGQKAIARHIQTANTAAIQTQIASLKKAPRGNPSEDTEETIAMYQECLAMRTSSDYQKIEDVGQMEVGSQGVRFTQGRCSNHAMRALDDLGEFVNRFGNAQLKPWMTTYGRALLLGEGQPGRPASPFGQVMRGTLGEAHVTVYLRALYEDQSVGGTYFYDRYRQPISLSGSYAEGVLTLREDGDKGQMRLTLQGESLRGEWQGSGRNLPVVLAP